MLKFIFILSTLFWAQTHPPAILSPQAGETLRGQVNIIGDFNVPNFSSAELAFSYASHPADSWFTIQTFSQIPTTQTLATWNTTLVTDGDYILYLRVLSQDGVSQSVAVSGLKIRNDEIPVTETIMPTEEQSSLFITATPLPLKTMTATPIFPTPTNFPPNPAAVTPASIYSYFARGGLIAIVAIFFFSLILRLRKN